MKNAHRLRLLLLAALPLSACQSDGYMSSVALTGAETRQDVVASITDAVDQQRAAVDALQTAGRALASIQSAGEADAVAQYSEYLDQIDGGAREVERFGSRLVEVDASGERLFAGWELELEQFSSDAIREQSSRRLAASRSGFALLREEMAGVHAQMEAMLSTHRDHALFLNHNLAASSRELLGAENRRFAAAMATLTADSGVVEADAATFTGRLAGSPGAPRATGDPGPEGQDG